MWACSPLICPIPAVIQALVWPPSRWMVQRVNVKMRGKLMTKFLTTAAWAALVLGGVAVADTPPAETADETVAEATAEPTTVTYGDVEEVEAEATETIAAVKVEGEDDAEDMSEESELDAEEADAPEAE